MMQRYKEIREKPNLSILIRYFCWTNIWTRRTKVRQSIGLVGQAGLYSIENSFPYIFCSNFALASLKLLQDLRVLIETVSRKTAAPLQSQKASFRFAFGLCVL